MNLISLENLLKFLCQSGNMHICINDLTGLLSHPLLALSEDFVMHYMPFCNLVKNSLNNTRRCFNFKLGLIEKAISGSKPFECECPFGMHQLIYPVKISGKICCIIYVCNITTDNHKTKNTLKELSKGFNVDFDEIEKSVKSLEKYISAEKYLTVARLVENHIENLYHSSKDDGFEYDKDKWLIGQIKDDIKKSYAAEISVKSEAYRYFYNEKYLGRLFKKETGQSFSSYLNEVRVKHASKYLSTTKKTVISIAEICGFNNVTHFNRVFKSVFSCTPLQYREKNNFLK